MNFIQERQKDKNLIRIPMHKELEQALNLLNEGKEEEALESIANFENVEELNQDDLHNYRGLKAFILFYMGRVQECLKIVEENYQESRKQNKPLLIIDSIFLKWQIMVLLGRAPKLWEDVVSCEKLLKSASQEPPYEVKLREGYLFFMKGYFHYWEHNYDKAIKHHKKCLEIFKNYYISLSIVPHVLNILGGSYTFKGELDLALKYNEESLALYKGSSLITKMGRAGLYQFIGTIFFQKGDLDQAIEYLKKSLKIFEQTTPGLWVAWVSVDYTSLIKVFLYKDSPDEAQEYLERFSHYLEQNKKSEKYPWYRLSKARLLRSSSRIRDRAEAEKILKQLTEKHKSTKSIANHGLSEEFSEVLIELCDYYLEELRSTNNLKIIDDIKPLVIRLLKESERTNSYTLQAQAHLLYGKISLLQMNMGDTRRYLTQAQHIAEEHSLQLLARAISTEHDNLLEQLDKWEEFKASDAPISERMALASLNESVELLQRKRAIKAPELINEEPVLLLILAGGGILLFSYPFSDEIKIEDEIFGGFLSALTSFSDEVFSVGLDRAKFGQYTVLMNNIADFSFCYVFKGQTYIAKKKLANFTENFQKNTSMMQILNKFNQTNQVIEVKDFPFLEGFIKEIFTNK